MSDSYETTNQGQIWPNKDKTSDKPHFADFTGTLDVGGIIYYVDAWKRETGANPKTPSLKFRIKRKG